MEDLEKLKEFDCHSLCNALHQIVSIIVTDAIKQPCKGDAESYYWQRIFRNLTKLNTHYFNDLAPVVDDDLTFDDLNSSSGC